MHEIDIGLEGPAAPFPRLVVGPGDLGPVRETVMHDERAAGGQQAEGLVEVAPGGAVFVPGIDQGDVEGEAVLRHPREAGADLPVGTAVVDAEAVAVLVGA